MATNPNTLPENSGRITAPDADYPYGSAKDDTTGTTGDGTPIKKALMNDTYGFYQKILTEAAITPTGNAETVNDSQLFEGLQKTVGLGRKNQVLDGGFNFWPEGTSFSNPSNSYTSSLIVSSTGGGGASTVSRQSFTIGQTDVPGNPNYFFRHDQTTSATIGNIIEHKIPGVELFAGEDCVLSFYAKVGSGTKDFFVRMSQNFGTGGSPSTGVTQDSSAFTLTTSWQKIELPFTMASISGKTLGTNGDDLFGIGFRESSSTTFTLDVANVQLEKGSIATEFEKLTLAEELPLIGLYYQKSYNLDITPGASTNIGAIRYVAAATSNQQHGVTFVNTMRSTPTVTIYSPVTGATGNMRNYSTAADVSASADNASSNGFQILKGSGHADGEIYSYHYVADSRL